MFAPCLLVSSGLVQAGLLSTADDQAWVVTSLVPDLAGELALGQATLSAAGVELVNRHPLIMLSSLAWGRSASVRAVCWPTAA
jgi:hypothetical protein